MAEENGVAPRARIVRLIVSVVVACAGLVLGLAQSHATHLHVRRLVVGSEQDFPPFAVGRSDATADGFTVELWKAVAKEQGLDYTIRVRPFDEILQGLKSGSVDVLINLARSEERQRFADFSVTHVEVGGAIFVRRGETRIRAENDLAGRSVIVLKGDLANDFAVGKGWRDRLVLVDSAETGLRLLAAGQHDAMLISKLAGLQTIRHGRIAGLQALDAKVGFSQRFAFAVRKGDTELLASINEGLALAKAHGDYDRLYEKWFGLYEDRPAGWGELWPALAAAALLAALAVAAAQARQRRRDRRAAAELRDSEERWKFALEGADDGVWDSDLAGGRTLYSRRWKQMLGYADHEIGSAPDEWCSRIHPEDRERVLAENQACIDGRTDVFVSEFRMRTKDGRWIWVLDRGKVVRRDADGRARRMIGTHSDISGRKAGEARAAAHADVMLLIATGASLPDILVAVARSVESARDWQCRILLSDDGGRQQPADAPGRPDGPPGWRCWPIVGSGGALLGTLATLAHGPALPCAADLDGIAEAVQIAAIAIERKRAEQALQDREERLQRALDASRLALWDYDLSTGEVYLSDAWSEMLGGPRIPARTTADALLALVPGEDRLRIGSALGDTLRGRTPSYSVEHRVRRPDGGTIWVLSQGRVVERGADGRVRRAVGTNRDITERKRAEVTQALLEAQLREAQKLEAIGTLAGGIAHDFNNILAAILGNVAFARQDIGEDHPVQPYLKQISKAGQRARSLVQQILAFSRKQAGEMLNQPLSPMVEETVAMLRTLAGPAVQLDVVLPDHPLDVKANLTQLQQVLLNLGTNAWQALPGGAGRIEIGLGEAVIAPGSVQHPARLGPGAYAQLWVRDDGCGMDEATRARIFEPFFTTKPVGQGTGLGLAVAHGIVEAHGGAIAVTTAVGQGSSFDIYLPLVGHESGLMPLEPDAGEPMRGDGQHVLYVDDDEVMAVMVQGLLERLGYRATCLLDAREAIAAVAHAPGAVDLVVTDFNMPNVSGLDLAREVARIRADLPVVISSGYVSDELRASATELGVRSILQKEHTLEELGAVVHESLSLACAIPANGAG